MNSVLKKRLGELEAELARRWGQETFGDCGECGEGQELFVGWVDPAGQRLVTRDRVFPISTSSKGLGNREGSFRTPTGWHRVVQIIGLDAPLGQVFVSRERQGVLSESEWREGEGDLIVSRILRLRGLESGVNQGEDEQGSVDSFDRYIYIHGTNHEEWIGRPASHGCIRMGNRDIAALAASIRTFCSFVYVES